MSSSPGTRSSDRANSACTEIERVSRTAYMRYSSVQAILLPTLATPSFSSSSTSLSRTQTPACCRRRADPDQGLTSCRCRTRRPENENERSSKCRAIRTRADAEGEGDGSSEQLRFTVKRHFAPWLHATKLRTLRNWQPSHHRSLQRLLAQLQ
ncbi:hypothetical protein PsYK624_133030 [Phanerochaete sordida]|uniref:Uncharacterized protein n=1 Tax=Phanerochaete sordida TaxID=48140 RepID=A0A9P3LJA6_9APHY|nr:hypothetical protein PsYK624_133030 [Phanerochaete sordida]